MTEGKAAIYVFGFGKIRMSVANVSLQMPATGNPVELYRIRRILGYRVHATEGYMADRDGGMAKV